MARPNPSRRGSEFWRRYSDVDATFLGMEGFAAYTKGLQGPLESFNGQMVMPRPQSNGSWAAFVKDRQGDELEIVVPRKFFVPIRNRAQRKASQQGLQGFSISMNNRSAAVPAFESLCQEISGAIVRSKAGNVGRVEGDRG